MGHPAMSSPRAALLAAAVAQRKGRQPMRVAIYSEIARAIRSGSLPPGELLPTEAELCASFAASRTVVREALILLEEDGLVSTRRGVGRFVSESLPLVGLEKLQSPEQLFACGQGSVDVRRLRAEQEGSTDFTEQGLNSGPGTVTLWESVLERDGVPLCICQEWTFPLEQLALNHPLLHTEVVQEHRAESLFGIVDRVYGGLLGPATCAIQVSNAGGARGRMLGVKPQTPVLLLSQQVLLDGAPVYLGKHIVRSDAVHLAIVQTSWKER